MTTRVLHPADLRLLSLVDHSDLDKRRLIPTASYADADLRKIIETGYAINPRRLEKVRVLSHRATRSVRLEEEFADRQEQLVDRLPTEIRKIGLQELLDAIADGANDPDLNTDAWLRKNRWDVALVRLRSAARWLRSRIPGRRISK